MSFALPKYQGPDTRALGRKMTNAEIRARFESEDAATYNQRKRLWLPEDAFAVSLMLDLLRTRLDLPETRRVLDLGAGAGGFSRHLLQAFPHCHMTLVDFSPNMLRAALQTLAEYAGRWETIVADFWEVDFPSHSFDGVVSTFALHHGRSEAIYGNLYGRIYAWLKPGGIFVCHDVVDGDAPLLSSLNENGWRQYLESQEFSQQDIERIFSNYACEDSPISLRQHLRLLESAGFTAADVLWKRYNFAVYAGIKG